MRHVCLAFALAAAFPQSIPARADDLADLLSVWEKEGKGSEHVAAKCLETAKGLEGDPKLRQGLYEKAYEYGVKQPKGYPVAMEAAQALLKALPEAKSTWRGNLLGVYELAWRSAPQDRKKEAGAELVDRLVSLGDELAEENEADQAVKLYTQASHMTRYYAPAQREEVAQKLKAAAEQQGLIRTAERYKHLLAENPENTVVRESLIRLYVAELDRPAEAQKLLTAGVLEELRTYVPLASGRLEDLAKNACVEMGNWYRALAAKARRTGKTRSLARACAYYERFLSLHDKQDVQGLTVKASLEQVEKELAELGADFRRVALLKRMGAILIMTFDEGTIHQQGGDTCVKDLGERGRSGRVAGATPEKGARGGALAFDGMDDYVQIKHDEALEVCDRSWSILFWVCPRAAGASFGAGLVDKSRHPIGGAGIWLHGQKIRYWYKANEDKDSRSEVPLNQWSHVGIAHDHAEQTVAFYINGALDQAFRVPSPMPSAQYDLEFGRLRGGANYFKGVLDEVYLFSRALSPDEVKQLSQR